MIRNKSLVAAGLAAAIIIAASAAWLNGRGESSEVAIGRTVYAEHCASCHGKNLEGQPDWQTRLPNGRLPAPPHDATGHTWHHSDDQLFTIVKKGISAIVPDYESDMLGFEGVISDDQIRAVLTFIKSTWPASASLRHVVQHGRRSQEQGMTRIRTALAGILLAQLAAAQTFSVGDLTVGPVWTRATPPGASTAVGYVTITNTGSEPDRLLRIEFAGAAEAQLHETKTAEGISSMRMMDSVPIPGNTTVELLPNGLHAMFTGLTGPLRTGDSVAGALVFEKAGRVEVEFRVEAMGATSPSQ